MPFLADPFKHDIFVSYSHGDFDGAGHSPLKRWSQQFTNDLNGQLRQIRELDSLSTFLDESQRLDRGVDPTMSLTGQLKDDIRASALLVILMTPHYLASGWCDKEREWWLTENRDAPIEIDGRIFVCRVIPDAKLNVDWQSRTDHAAWPDALRDLAGFWFHSREDVDVATVPFRWEGSTNDVDNYNKVMRELVRRIARRLGEVKARQEQLATEATQLAQLAGGSQVIYLHARETQHSAWQEAQQSLQDNGHLVFPGAPETQINSQQIDARTVWTQRQERIRQLVDCDALLLLGTEPSTALETDLLAIGHRDRQNARDLSGKLLPCALLNQTGSPVPITERFAIEDVDGRMPDWPDDIAAWLRRCGQQMEAVL